MIPFCDVNVLWEELDSVGMDGCWVDTWDLSEGRGQTGIFPHWVSFPDLHLINTTSPSPQ